VFQDVLSQTLQGASAPSAAGATPVTGGTNPAQVGLGVRLGGISTNTAQGASQLTGRATDLAVQGDGYFVVSQGGQILYTRAGSFSLDSTRQLVTPSGALVQGYAADNAGAFTDPGVLAPIALPMTRPGATTTPAPALESYSIGPNGVVTGTFSDGETQAIARIALANFNNPGGLDKVGGSMLRPSMNSGEARVGNASADGRGTLAVGVLEMSNVDLAQEFTNMIVSQRGFQANSRVITTSDELLQELVNLKR
jgi:flagellar hook protein FlgE